MTLKIYLLGQFKLQACVQQADDQPIELPSRPAQSLLAYLALNAGVTQRREKLANLLWPDTSESNARSYLRQALWRIRKSGQEKLPGRRLCSSLCSRGFLVASWSLAPRVLPA